MQTSLSGLCGRVEVSPPEVGGEQLVVLVHRVEVEGQLLRGVEVPHVDEGVRWSRPGHVGAVQHDGNHVVGQKVEEFLRYVVLGQRGLQRDLNMSKSTRQTLFSRER